MLQCPQCDAEIVHPDFNVSTDLAYCRNCQVELKYSELRARINGRIYAEMPCPNFVMVEDLGDHIEITYRRIHPVVWFLIPFTCLWSGLSIGLGLIVPLVEGKLELSKAAFMLPFVFGTIALVTVVCLLFFGRTRIALHGESSEVFRGAGLLGFRQRFDFNSVGSVIIRKSSMSVNDVNLPEICLMMKVGNPVAFGATMTDDARDYIASAIASQLESR